MRPVELPGMANSDPPSSRQGWAESLTPGERAELLHRIMARQAGLSAGVAAVFLAIVLGLPLVNWLAPALAQTNIAGFPLTWLVLGVLFYPITWGLSALFIRRSNELEDTLAAEGTGAHR